MAEPKARELSTLQRAPRSAALIVLSMGASLVALAWAVGVSSPVALGAAGLVVLSGAAFALSRTAKEQAALNTSIDSVSAALSAWADGVSAKATIEHPLTSELSAACTRLLRRLERAEEETNRHGRAAREADRDRLAFLADFSHELRTPLNSILGFAHVLESEAEGPLDAEGREAIAIILASGEQLRALIEDVLDLTALETDALEGTARPVDITGIAEEITRTAQGVAQHKGVKLAFDATPDVVASFDEKRLRRILWNLISRALRATEAGTVTVVVRRSDDGGATVSVIDEGKPVSRLEREAIESGTLDESPSREGIGIGLGVAGRIVRHFGGRIVIADPPRGGSIRLVLPTASQAQIDHADATRASMVFRKGSGRG